MTFDPWEQCGEVVRLNVSVRQSTANNLSDLIKVSLELSEPYSVGVDSVVVDSVGVDGVRVDGVGVDGVGVDGVGVDGVGVDGVRVDGVGVDSVGVNGGVGETLNECLFHMYSQANL